MLRCIVVFLTCTRAALCFSAEQPVYHFFNAQLMPPGHGDLNTIGNLRAGVSENFELGTNAWLVLGGKINFLAKHRMFELGPTTTSFSSFSLYTDTSKGWSLFNLFGIVTTYAPPGATVSYNFGAFDASSWSRGGHDSSLLHSFIPLVGLDWLMSPSTVLITHLLVPLYLSVEASSDFGDGELQANTLNGLAGLSIFDTSLGYVGLRVLFSSTSGDIGVYRVGSGYIPYLGLNWRF